MNREDRLARFLLDAKALGIHVLDSQDEDGRPEFGPANAIATFDNVWVRGTGKCDSVLLLGCKK